MVTNYEALAETIRHGLALDERASPFAYAARMHLEIEPANACANGAELIGRTIYWNACLPREEQRLAVAREVCRWVLRASFRDESEESVDALLTAVFTSYGSSLLKQPTNVRYLRALPRTAPTRRTAASSRTEPSGAQSYRRRSAPSGRRP